MSHKSIDESLFSLMLHAEELQKIAQKKIEAMPNMIADLVNSNFSQVEKDLEKSKNAIIELCNVAKNKCEIAKKRTVISGVTIFGIGLVVSVFFYFFLGFINDLTLDELNEIKLEVAQQKSTLRELNNETWGLVLLKHPDGTRQINLPSNLKFNFEGKLENGQKALVFNKPN